MSLTAIAPSGATSFVTEYLTPEEVALRLRCSALTLAKWRARGYGPKWQRIGPQRVGYRPADVTAYLAKASA
jgi:predicted DNA-binding transcriptional regulator AlpA